MKATASNSMSWIALGKRWIAASFAAIVIGTLLGFALLPNPNSRLLADLPAIQQINVLRYVTNIELLRELSKVVPTDQMVKDDAAFANELKELEAANDSS